MTLEQIATMMNERVVPAVMGDSFTLSPDLSNIIDFGTAISSMTASQFKDYMDSFVVGIARTITDDREYSPEKLPFYIDEQEYGGAVQSIKADMFTVQDSHLYSLVDGQTYNDVNKFFGTAFNNRVYEKDDTYQIVKSIPEYMYKKAFTSAQGVAEITNYIERLIRNTERRAASALEHNLLAALAKVGKKINLVTMFNLLVNGSADPAVDPVFAAIYTDITTTGEAGSETTYTTVAGKPTEVTAANCIYNPTFMKWAINVIKNVSDAMPFANKKYNDGTVSTWLPVEDRVRVFNSAFINAYEVFLKADTRNRDEVDIDGGYYKTPFWNIQPADMVPTVVNSSIVGDTKWTEVEGEQTESNDNLPNVIGLVFDRYAAGYTRTPIPTAMSYNESGRFFNMFIDINNRYFVDTRNTAVVFTLN